MSSGYDYDYSWNETSTAQGYYSGAYLSGTHFYQGGAAPSGGGSPGGGGANRGSVPVAGTPNLGSVPGRGQRPCAGAGPGRASAPEQYQFESVGGGPGVTSGPAQRSLYGGESLGGAGAAGGYGGTQSLAGYFNAGYSETGGTAHVDIGGRGSGGGNAFNYTPTGGQSFHRRQDVTSTPGIATIRVSGYHSLNESVVAAM